ncbi:hypothetical protein NL676_037925 [Syzygium grande]|nr:hypothetical protein NL676_037925 [Syzygium grande]
MEGESLERRRAAEETVRMKELRISKAPSPKTPETFLTGASRAGTETRNSRPGGAVYANPTKPIPPVLAGPTRDPSDPTAAIGSGAPPARPVRSIEVYPRLNRAPSRQSSSVTSWKRSDGPRSSSALAALPRFFRYRNDRLVGRSRRSFAISSLRPLIAFLGPFEKDEGHHAKVHLH